MASNNKRITEFFKPGKQTPVGSKETSGREEDADTGSYHTPGAPKRKITYSLTGESPLKRRKFNSVEGGVFSKSRTVPTCIAVRDSNSDNHGPAESRSDNEIGIVVVDQDQDWGR
jgi:hypothetical protein